MKQIPSDQIKDQPNNLFTSIDNVVRVAGARFSRKGNLVLSVTPAISAQHILTSDWAATTISCLRDSLGFSERVAQTTKIYPADPWHRAVIHNIPLRDVQQGPKGTGSWWEQNSATRYLTPWQSTAGLLLVSSSQNISDDELRIVHSL